MPWRLAPEAYWRYDGDDLIVAVPTGVLRLNASAAEFFVRLLRCEDCPGIKTTTDEGDALSEIFRSASVIVYASEPTDPFAQYLSHLGP